MGITEFTDLKYNDEKNYNLLILVTHNLDNVKKIPHFHCVCTESPKYNEKTPLLPEG